MARHNIINGPGKFELCTSFFNKIDGKRLEVSFTIPDFPPGQQEIGVVINRLGWEDGSGDSWNFEGFSPNYTYNLVKGWFRTSDRKGWIELEPARQVSPEFKSLIGNLVRQRKQR